MGVTVIDVYTEILEKADKMGSDYFPLPVVLNRFETATYDFIGENVKAVEVNQEIKDDIRTLITRTKQPILEDCDPCEAYSYTSPFPNDYHHLLRANPLYKGLVYSRRPRIIRHGQVDAHLADPHNKPTKEYPIIVQMQDYVRVYVGGSDEKPDNVLMIYVKKPTFGVNDDDIIVDLPIQSIEEIKKKVVNSLFVNTGDSRSQIHHQVKEVNFRSRRQ